MLYVGAGLFALCDWEDWPLVRGYWWHLTTDKGDVRYAQTWSTHQVDTRMRLTMHGIILPNRDGLICDHINGDGLDNRRANLRLATPRQNSWNRRARTNTASKHKGVSFCRRSGLWRADISIDGSRKYLGRFGDENAAAAAYRAASEKVQGRFAEGASRG